MKSEKTKDAAAVCCSGWFGVIASPKGAQLISAKRTYARYVLSHISFASQLV